ncbi:MAG: hypothetical protein SFV81_08760 [Pirellulaceae bacterium]|nr:hypothetical protein [Pirellulaceae bacterium]
MPEQNSEEEDVSQDADSEAADLQQADSQEADSTDADALPMLLQQSICSRCVERKIVRSGKGSVFLLCQVGVSNPNWPKYPPQPVRRCPKFRAE